MVSVASACSTSGTSSLAFGRERSAGVALFATLGFALFLVHFGDRADAPALVWTGILASSGLLARRARRHSYAALAAVSSCLPVPLTWLVGGVERGPWLPVNWAVLACATAVAVWPLERARAFLLALVVSFVGSAVVFGQARLALVPLAVMAVASLLALLLGAELSDLQAAGSAAGARSRRDLREATERAAASEELYRSVFESARDAIVISDAETAQILAANARAAELHGHPAASLVGLDTARFVDGPEPALMVELRARGYAQDVEYRHRGADGQERRLVMNASLIRYQGREAVLSVLTDVTSLHALQARLSRANEDLERTVRERTAELESSRNLFASLAAGAPAAIIRADASGHWTWASTRWTELTGVTAEQSHGAGWLAALAREDQELVATNWGRAVQDGRSFRAECRLARPRSSGPAWVIVSAVPDRDRDGHVLQYVGTVTDISDLMRGVELTRSLAETLRASSRQWRKIFDAVPDVLVSVDADGRLLKLNQAAADLAALPLTVALGQPLSSLRPVELWGRVHELALEALRCADAVGRRWVPGPGRAWSLRATPVVGAQPAQAVVVARDVSAEAALESVLRRRAMDELAAELLAGLAHELRNPLFAISALTDALADEQPGPAWEHLRLETARLSALIERLLQQADVRPGAELEVDLRHLLTDCLEGLRRSFPEISLDVRFEPPDAASGLLVEAHALEAAVAALVRNACQHSAPGGQVEVLARLDAAEGGGRWSIGVRDQGPGFSPPLLERGPRPFYTTRRAAVGLGLTQALQIAEHLGGSLDLSNPVAGGAVAVLRFRDRREAR